VQHADEPAESLALRRSRHPDLTDEEWAFCLRQIDGKQRMRRKLPEIAAGDDWLYPRRLNMEQCSSEITARYKERLLRKTGARVLADLTGGFGIDTYYMSRAAEETHYVERDEELCRLAAHNLPTDGRAIRVHHATAEEFLLRGEGRFLPAESTLLYMDPARRNAGGGRVFRLSDCEPDAEALMPLLRERAKHVLLKLSPMLDLSAAQNQLGKGETHIVATGGEVKEVLMLFTNDMPPHETETETVTATDLKSGLLFRFTANEEQQAVCPFCGETKTYLYEPHAAVLKAGAYKLAGARYGLGKLAPNTHLYTSDTLHSDFPGRIFRILAETPQRGGAYHTISRNHPLRSEELARKLHLHEGGELFVIGARAGHRPTVMVAELLQSAPEHQNNI